MQIKNGKKGSLFIPIPNNIIGGTKSTIKMPKEIKKSSFSKYKMKKTIMP